MGASVENDYILVQILKGINYLAKQRRIDGFFSAMNLLTGQNIKKPEIMTEDIFGAYHEKSAKKGILKGLQEIYLGVDEIDFNSIIKDINPVSVEKLRNTLMLLEFYADHKLKEGIKDALWQLRGIGSDIEFSPERIAEIMRNSPELSFSERAIIYLKGLFAKPEPFAGKVTFELDEKEKLKLAFAASVDDLAFKYVSFPYMSTIETLNSFFLGICNFVFPVKKREINFNYRSEKCIDLLLDAYEFDSESRNKFKVIMGWPITQFASFHYIAYYRMKEMKTPLSNEIEMFVSQIGKEGKIQLNQNTINNLSFYGTVTETQIEVLKGLSKMRKELVHGDHEKLEKLDKIIGSKIISIEPKMSLNYFPHESIGEIFEARNFVSRINNLAINYCRNILGEIRCDEAAELLLRYFNAGFPEFKEEKIIRAIKQ